MDALMLRTAEASDLAQLAALERAAFEMDRLSRRALQYSLTAATRRVLVITRGPRLLASVVVCVRRDSRHLRIYSLAVDGRWTRLREASVSVRCCWAPS